MTAAPDPIPPSGDPPKPALNSGCLIAPLALAGLLYVVTMLGVSDLGASDAAGDGLTAFFTMLFLIATWVLLGLFVFLCCRRSRASGLLYVVWALLFFGGAIACLVAVSQMSSPNWLGFVPALLPLIAAAYGVWVLNSADQPAARRRRGALGHGALGLVLIAVPLVAYAKWAAEEPEREADYARQEAQAREAYLAELRALGPNSPIEAYFLYLDGEHEAEALAGIRAAQNRQADAARLLGLGFEQNNLSRLHEFGLDATSELCAAYRAALDRRLGAFIPTNPDWERIPISLYDQQANYRWLMAGGCDLTPQITRLAAQERTLDEGLQRMGYAEELDAIVAEGVGTADSKRP